MCGNFHFHYKNFLKLNFVEYVRFAKNCQWNDSIVHNFICLYITWKKWKIIHKIPQMEILSNIWWKSLHRNSRYCQRGHFMLRKNGLLVKRINVLDWIIKGRDKSFNLKVKNFVTLPFLNFQMRSDILIHCVFIRLLTYLNAVHKVLTCTFTIFTGDCSYIT